MPSAPPRYGIAIRAAISIGLPLTVLTLFGRPDIGLQMAPGAFTVLFAAGATPRERAKILPFIVFLLVANAAAGALLAPSRWTFAIGLVLVTIVTATVTFAFRLGPPGAIFFVLMYGLSANITRVENGERSSDPVVFLLALTAGAVFAYMISVIPILNPRVRSMPARSLRELLPGPWLGRDERTLMVRIAIAAVVGTTVSMLWLDGIHAYWAVAASVAVIGLSADKSYSLQRGLHRTIGTVLGAGLYVVLAPLGDNLVILIVLLTALQFVIELVVVRNYALALIFVTPLVLLITAATTTSGDLMSTALERVLDTVIGAAIAIATSFLHRTSPRGTLAP